MALEPRFSEAMQRVALLALADSPSFLHSEEGRALLGQIREQFAPPLLAGLRDLGAGTGWLTPDDVVHTAVVGLSAERGRVARYAAAAQDEPWGYVFRCLQRWLREQLGTRGMPLDDSTAQRLIPHRECESLTPLAEVVDLTARALRVHSPARLSADLTPFLQWLALNPPQRLSYEAADREAAQRAFPRFSFSEIAAVMNAAWGVRPHRAETSLMAAYLRDALFCPSDSPTHSRALLRYRRAMRRAEPETMTRPAMSSALSA